MSGGCWWVAGSRPWSLLAPSVFPYYVQGLSGETHGPAVSTHAPLLSGKRGSAERQQSRYYGSPSLRVRVTSTTSFFESEEVLTRFEGECLDAIRGNFPDGGEVNRNALLWAWLEARPAACERTEERSVLRVIGDAGGNGSRAAWPWHPCDNPYFRDAKNSRQGPRPPGGHLARRVLASRAAWWPSWPRPATSHAIESDRKIKLPLQDPGLLGGDPPHELPGFPLVCEFPDPGSSVRVRVSPTGREPAQSGSSISRTGEQVPTTMARGRGGLHPSCAGFSARSVSLRYPPGGGACGGHNHPGPQMSTPSVARASGSYIAAHHNSTTNSRQYGTGGKSPGPSGRSPS